MDSEMTQPISEFYDDFPHAVIPAEIWKGKQRAKFSLTKQAANLQEAMDIVVSLTEFYINMGACGYTAIYVMYRTDRHTPVNTKYEENLTDYPLIRDIIYLSNMERIMPKRHVPEWHGGIGDSYNTGSAYSSVNSSISGSTTLGYFNGGSGNCMNKRGY